MKIIFYCIISRYKCKVSSSSTKSASLASVLPILPVMSLNFLAKMTTWKCNGCNSSYIGETSRALGKRVKEHSKSTTLAILKHCKDFHHPLPSISNFSIIDKDSSQITREAKEAIHIRRLDPNLNRNIGKMSIPHCFDPLISAKPKHPQVGALSQTAPHPVDEIAPPSQIPGLNLTQFNNIGTFRPNVAQHIPKPSTRACRARNLFNWSLDWLSCLPHIYKQGQALYHLTRIE